MFDSRHAAAGFGVAVELADLGDWGDTLLIAEYDPAGPVIRVNARAIERYRTARGRLSSCDVRSFIDVAVAHELYHHREAIGAIAVLPTRAQREEAADAYARANVPVDAELAAFLADRR